jgi:hypothetical protein
MSGILDGLRIVAEIVAHYGIKFLKGELRIQGNGKVSWGDAGDVELVRSAANRLSLGANDHLDLLTTSKIVGTMNALTLGAGAVTFAAAGMAMVITGDGGANVIATITGGTAGQTLLLEFVDANVTITDTAGHAANTIDLLAAADLVSADDTFLLLVFDGTSWYEICRSVN